MGKYTRKSSRKLAFTEDVLRRVRERIVNGESVRSIATSIGSPESSLRKRLAAGSVPTSLGRFGRTFDTNAENELAAHCRNLHDRFYGLTTRRLMEIAYEYAERNGIKHRFNTAKRCAGRDWVRSFCRRHSISVRTSEKRPVGLDRSQFDRFFRGLRQFYAEEKFPPSRIFSVDETGVSTVPNATPKGKRPVGKHVAEERGELVTAICCFSAVGVYVPPALIFPRKRMKRELFEDAPDGTLPMISESGFINGELFLSWLSHFQEHAKSTEEEQVLLILDNHASHCTLDAINFCGEHFISLLSLPPHASHKLQPLDRGFFGPLKRIYAEECDAWMTMNPGCSIKQDQVASLFANAYARVAGVETALGSFASSGIYPFNPSRFADEDFLPSEPIDEVISPEKARSLNPDLTQVVPPIATQANYLPKRRKNVKKSEIVTLGTFRANVESKSGDTAKRPAVTEQDVVQPGSSKDPVPSCPGCGEKYADSPVGHWVRCKKCANWWNEAPSCYECGELGCEHC